MFIVPSFCSSAYTFPAEFVDPELYAESEEDEESDDSEHSEVVDRRLTICCRRLPHFEHNAQGSLAPKFKLLEFMGLSIK